MNETAIRNLNIVNSGKFNFDFTWVFPASTDAPNPDGDIATCNDSMVAIQPMTGHVPHGSKQTCQLEFCPPRQISITNCNLLLKVSVSRSFSKHCGTLWWCYFPQPLLSVFRENVASIPWSKIEPEEICKYQTITAVFLNRSPTDRPTRSKCPAQELLRVYISHSSATTLAHRSSTMPACRTSPRNWCWPTEIGRKSGIVA